MYNSVYFFWGVTALSQSYKNTYLYHIGKTWIQNRVFRPRLSSSSHFIPKSNLCTKSSKNLKKYTVTFCLPDGSKVTGDGKEGDTILDVVINNNIEIDGFGACEGSLACSTCHVIFQKEDYDKISSKLEEEEIDLLDLAYGLTETLGCQVYLNEKLGDFEVKVPPTTFDVRNSDQ